MQQNFHIFCVCLQNKIGVLNILLQLGLVTGGLLIILTATAKSFLSCPTLCNPIDSSPPGSPVPGILQARTASSGSRWLESEVNPTKLSSHFIYLAALGL